MVWQVSTQHTSFAGLGLHNFLLHLQPTQTLLTSPALLIPTCISHPYNLNSAYAYFASVSELAIHDYFIVEAFPSPAHPHSPLSLPDISVTSQQ